MQIFAGRLIENKRPRQAICLASLVVITMGGTRHSIAAPQGIQIKFTLPKSSLVTLVVEDAASGKRIRNLIAETRMPAGANTVVWDGYDEGARDQHGDLVRRRAAPGRYIVRGLTHEGIHLKYEFGVNSPGTPPWFTNDHSGAWMADHSPPLGVVFLPPGSGSPYGNGQDQMMLCGKAAENGDPIIWSTLTGRKLYGTKVFGWGGGVAIGRDAGPNARPDVLAYLIDAEHKNISIRAITKTGDGIGIADLPAHAEISFDNGRAGNSIAAFNGMLAVSVPRDNSIAFVDARTKKQIGSVSISNPKGLWFDGEGRLLVVSNTSIHRFHVDVSAGNVTLNGDQVIVTSGLDDPQQITQASNGKIYVTDWGTSHQVKVFSAAGEPVRIIGHPGGPRVGFYDQLRMHYPKGVAVDSQGQIWVTDADYAPKRVSIWSADGKLVRAIIGGPMYGGGGTLDPQDRSRFYYHVNDTTMEFHLDWARGTYSLRSIPVRPDVQNADHMPGSAPERAIYLHGRQYMVADCNPGLRANGGEAIWLMNNKTGVAWPVAVAQGAHSIGAQHGWLVANSAVKDQWPQDQDQKVALWSDRNGDHRVEPGELNFIEPKGSRYFNAPTYGDDLAVTFNNGALHLDAPQILSNGVPVYHGQTAHYLMPGIDIEPDTGQKFALNDGRVLVMPASGYKDGRLQWSYPWYTEEQLPQSPGQMVDPTRLMGRPIHFGQAGEIYAVNGDKGSMFLVTADGLFLQTLGGDTRIRPLLRLQHARRGMLVDGYSFAGEDFGPTITQESDGRVYIITGHEFTAVFDLIGLETIRRQHFGNLKLTSQNLAAYPAIKIERGRRQTRQVMQVAVRNTAIQIDGNLRDWPATTCWATIDAHTSAAIAVDDENLYAAWRTNTPNLLANDGGDFRFLFKRGGALDLMLATDAGSDAIRQSSAAGDLRLLITRVKGRIKAVLSRAVAPGAPPSDAILYTSPVGQVAFDQVIDISNSIRLAQNGGSYEISVPLSVLHLSPKANESIFGDIGVLRGSGTTTSQRVYWNNRETSIVSDIPSEARLQPGNWGVLEFNGSTFKDKNLGLTPK